MRTRTRRVALLVVAAVVVLTGGAAACALPPVVPGAPAPNCSFTTYAPIVEEQTGKQMIEARVIAECVKTPDSHHIHISIERQLVDWTAVDPGDGSTYSTCDGSPYAGNPVTCQRLIPCVAGHYRTRVTVTGHDLAGDFARSEDNPPDSVLTCATS